MDDILRQDAIAGTDDEDLRYYPCPCCGHYVFRDPPGSFAICPICFWEDDLVMLRFALQGGGANRYSLLESQRNYARRGACELRCVEFARPSKPEEVRETGWRMVNPDVDAIEEAIAGVEYGSAYPKDNTTLYYWRETFWRRCEG